MSTQKVALVTGASSGIGESTARELAARGFAVYAAARRVERMAGLEAAGIRVLALDVTDDASIVAAVETIQAETGRLDVLVNNAGYGQYGAVEDVPLDDARRQLEVNVFGAARLIQLALPLMRREGWGRIVNVTSIGGKIATPFGAWYHASKFALEGLSDALRAELRPFGISVVVVEPGAIQTEWGDIAMDSGRAVSGSGPYASHVNRVADGFSNGPSVRNASDPQVIADVIAEAVTVRRPRTRYAAGYLAKPILAVRRILPDRAFDMLMARAMG